MYHLSMFTSNASTVSTVVPWLYPPITNIISSITATVKLLLGCFMLGTGLQWLTGTFTSSLSTLLSLSVPLYPPEMYKYFYILGILSFFFNTRIISVILKIKVIFLVFGFLNKKLGFVEKTGGGSRSCITFSPVFVLELLKLTAFLFYF